MTGLERHLDEYLSLRRALGYKLEEAGRLLADFTHFAERAGVLTVSVDVAVAWATLPAQASPIWVAKRLAVVRGFARYLRTVDCDAEVPPVDLLAAAPARRPVPFLFAAADIAALMAAARSLRNPLRSATFETLIGLLAVTGLRGGEAMRLDRDDIDWGHGLLTVRDTKFGKSRQLHLHPTTLAALRCYETRRDRLCPRPATASLFVSASGTRLRHATVQPTFRALVDQARLGQQNPKPSPRIHSLRHSFAVNTLLGWYRDGQDVQARLPALSTWLGHVDPGSTYWYLSAAPELLGLAARRLETTFGGTA
jgi:integrase